MKNRHTCKLYTFKFSRQELIHLRRALRRAVDCASGECPGTPSATLWYFLQRPRREIDAALSRKPNDTAQRAGNR